MQINRCRCAGVLLLLLAGSPGVGAQELSREGPAKPKAVWVAEQNGGTGAGQRDAVTPKPAEKYCRASGIENARASAEAPDSAPTATADAGIADNSFLIEEAYNQERGVVQHINAFRRGVTTDDWAYTFTQEWPVNPAPRHQLSYTLASVSGGAAGAGSGWGDILLNYRYQLFGSGETRAAFAPRASLLVPSGSSRHGRGAGGAGVQFNLPLSVRLADRLVTHWNAGATIVPRAKNEVGDRATTYNYFLGQSFLFRAHRRFHLMLETLFDSAQQVVAPKRAQWDNSVTINPGFRWAHNFESGLQIVPGIGFPVEVGRAGRGNWGIFLYLSFEHPFGGARGK